MNKWDLRISDHELERKMCIYITFECFSHQKRFFQKYLRIYENYMKICLECLNRISENIKEI